MNGSTANMANNNIDYEHFSDRLIESISMVRELLYSNKELRELTDDAKKNLISVNKSLWTFKKKIKILGKNYYK